MTSFIFGRALPAASPTSKSSLDVSEARVRDRVAKSGGTIEKVERGERNGTIYYKMWVSGVDEGRFHEQH